MDNNYQLLLKDPLARHEVTIYDAGKRGGSMEIFHDVEIIHAEPGMIHFIGPVGDIGMEEHLFCSSTLHYHISKMFRGQ